MDSIRSTSGFLFYTLGVVLLALIVLVKRGLLPLVAPYLHVLDLPMVFIAMLYGGSSLYTSLARGKSSLPLLLVIFVPLVVLFAVFCWFNFALPFADVSL